MPFLLQYFNTYIYIAIYIYLHIFMYISIYSKQSHSTILITKSKYPQYVRSYFPNSLYIHSPGCYPMVFFYFYSAVTLTNSRMVSLLPVGGTTACISDFPSLNCRCVLPCFMGPRLKVRQHALTRLYVSQNLLSVFREKNHCTALTWKAPWASKTYFYK